MSKTKQDNPSGPFCVCTNEHGKPFLQYDVGNGLHFSQIMPRSIKFILESLVKWLNRVLANE